MRGQIINPSLRPRRRGFWVDMSFPVRTPSSACAQSANLLGPWTPTTWNGDLRLSASGHLEVHHGGRCSGVSGEPTRMLPLEGGGSIMLIKVGEKRVGRSEVGWGESRVMSRARPLSRLPKAS